MKSFKVSLRSCVKHAEIPHVIPLIESAVKKMHVISTKTLLLLKLYCIRRHNLANNVDFEDIITEDIIFMMMKIIAGDKGQVHGNLTEENRQIRNELLDFYNGHFAALDDTIDVES